jgi:hypothetical protein
VTLLAKKKPAVPAGYELLVVIAVAALFEALLQ